MQRRRRRDETNCKSADKEATRNNQFRCLALAKEKPVSLLRFLRFRSPKGDPVIAPVFSRALLTHCAGQVVKIDSGERERDRKRESGFSVQKTFKLELHARSSIFNSSGYYLKLLRFYVRDMTSLSPTLPLSLSLSLSLSSTQFSSLFHCQGYAMAIKSPALVYLPVGRSVIGMEWLCSYFEKENVCLPPKRISRYVCLKNAPAQRQTDRQGQIRELVVFSPHFHLN